MKMFDSLRYLLLNWRALTELQQCPFGFGLEDGGPIGRYESFAQMFNAEFDYRRCVADGYNQFRSVFGRKPNAKEAALIMVGVITPHVTNSANCMMLDIWVWAAHGAEHDLISSVLYTIRERKAVLDSMDEG